MHHGMLTPSGCSEQAALCSLLLNKTAESGTWCKLVVMMEEEISLILRTAQGCQAHTCRRAGLAAPGRHGCPGTGEISICKPCDPEQFQHGAGFPAAALTEQLSGWEVNDHSHKAAQGSQGFSQLEEISYLLPNPQHFPLSPPRSMRF